jgi:hypothetical protein
LMDGLENNRKNTKRMRGRTNNPHGRPKGIPNKKNAELREKISKLIEDNWQSVQSDIERLEPRDRLNFLEKLLSYSLPKLQSVQVENDQSLEADKITIFKLPDNGRGFDVKSMSDEELRAIVNIGYFDQGGTDREG